MVEPGYYFCRHHSYATHIPADGLDWQRACVRCSCCSELPVTLERPGDVTHTQGWAMTLHVRLDWAIGWILLYLPQMDCSEIQKVVQMPLLRCIPTRASSYAFYKSTMGAVTFLAIFSLLTFLSHPLLGIVLSNKPIAHELCFRICSLGNLDKNKGDEKFTFPGVAYLLWYYRWIWSCVHLLSWIREHSACAHILTVHSPAAVRLRRAAGQTLHLLECQISTLVEFVATGLL